MSNYGKNKQANQPTNQPIDQPMDVFNGWIFFKKKYFIDTPVPFFYTSEIIQMFVLGLQPHHTVSNVGCRTLKYIILFRQSIIWLHCGAFSFMTHWSKKGMSLDTAPKGSHANSQITTFHQFMSYWLNSVWFYNMQPISTSATTSNHNLWAKKMLCSKLLISHSYTQLRTFNNTNMLRYVRLMDIC